MTTIADGEVTPLITFPRPTDALRAVNVYRSGLPEGLRTTIDPPPGDEMPIFVTADLGQYLLGMLRALPADTTLGDLRPDRWPVSNPFFVLQEPVIESGPKVMTSAGDTDGVPIGAEVSQLLHTIQPISFKGYACYISLVSTSIGLGVSMYQPVEERRNQRVVENLQRHGSMSELMAWALSVVCEQRIVSNTPAVVSRQVRRQAERKNLPPVRVLDLRTPQRASEGSFSREWHHRWVVRGHWRRQWYPASQTHKLIWIDPYIKGPDDKPLDLRPTVWRADA